MIGGMEAQDTTQILCKKIIALKGQLRPQKM